MQITNVHLNDLKAIYKLELTTFKEQAFSKEVIREFFDNNYLFLKLEKNFIKKKLIGAIIGVKDRKDRINIVNFLIHPKYQNQRYGALLLKQAISFVQTDDNIKFIVLNVKTDNQIAIHLYQKFDFVILQKINHYYQNGESAFLMQLKLRDQIL